MSSPSSGPPGAATEPNPNRLPVPTQGTSATMVRKQLYAYSMELINEGPKPIKALAWDFVFTDGSSQTVMKRQSLANLQKIGVHEKKTIRFTTQASPPRTASIGGLQRDQNSPFIQSATIQCVQFADDSLWEQPQSNACKGLLQWIELRKKFRPGDEDLPLKN